MAAQIARATARRAKPKRPPSFSCGTPAAGSYAYTTPTCGCARSGACRPRLMPLRPGDDRLGMRQDGSVLELHRGQLRVAGGLAQLLARALAQERDRVATAG